MTSGGRHDFVTRRHLRFCESIVDHAGFADANPSTPADKFRQHIRNRLEELANINLLGCSWLAKLNRPRDLILAMPQPCANMRSLRGLFTTQILVGDS